MSVKAKIVLSLEDKEKFAEVMRNYLYVTTTNIKRHTHGKKLFKS